MHGTTTSVRPPGGFPGARANEGTPELDNAWRPWLRLLEVAITAADDPGWRDCVPDVAGEQSAGAPLLHGTEMRVDARRLRRLARDLLREAEWPAGEPATAKPRGRRLDVTAMLHHALAHDDHELARLATSAGVDGGRFAVVAQLAAIPVLRACAVALGTRVPADWLHGYCPICGAWPALAELRGLERSRRLRCGRCACDWPLPVLRCPFCDELRHDRLRALMPEGEEHTRRIDTCDTCNGYMKTISTLQPMPLRTLATTDLQTVDLDLVAQERGFARPSRPGYPVLVGVVRAGSRAVAPDPLP